MTDRSTRRPTRRQAALGITALAGLSLTACTGGGEEAASEDSATSPSGAAQPSDGGGQDQAAQGEVESSTAVDPADAIATLSYPLLTDGIDGSMTVGLHHLRVRGRTMELLLTFTPEFSGNDTFNLYELHGENGNNFWPVLFDRVNLKRYDVLQSGRGRPWFTEDQMYWLASGDTQPFWANFAAPEDDIETIDVGISTGPAFEDVPIDRGSASPSGGTGGEDGEG